MRQSFVQIEKRTKFDREELSRIIAAWEDVQSGYLRSEPIPLGKLSGRIERSFLTPKDVAAPDCQTCGLCCALFPMVQVESTDLTLPENYWEITIQTSKGEFASDRVVRRDSKSGFCHALAGEIGKSVGCQIYETRPNTCRRFEAGSDKCHALRRGFGLEMPLNPIETADALRKIFEKDVVPDKSKIIYQAQINPEADACEIGVWLEDDSFLIIHRYDINKETWLEGDLAGLTLAEAERLIHSRAAHCRQG